VARLLVGIAEQLATRFKDQMHSRACGRSEVVANTFEDRMTHLAFRRLCPVLDFCQQWRLPPISLDARSSPCKAAFSGWGAWDWPV